MPRKQKYPAATGVGGIYLRELVAKNAAQDYYLNTIRETTVTFGVGPAGTGKTLLATYVALQALLNGEVEKIILTRPIVATEDIGYLPGTMEEKIHPYILPLLDSLEVHIGMTKTKEMIEDGRLRVEPLAFLRGRSLNNCVTADSLVTLESGEQIRIDELLCDYEAGKEVVVKSFNLETKEIENSPISYAFKQPAIGNLLKITLEDGTVLKVTKDHELYLEDGSKIKAEHLKYDDKLLKM